MIPRPRIRAKAAGSIVEPAADALIAFVVISVLLAVTPDGANCVHHTAGLLTRGSLQSFPFPALSCQWFWKVARRSQSRGRLRLRCRGLVHRPHSRFSRSALTPLITVWIMHVSKCGGWSSAKPSSQGSTTSCLTEIPPRASHALLSTLPLAFSTASGGRVMTCLPEYGR